MSFTNKLSEIELVYNPVCNSKTKINSSKDAYYSLLPFFNSKTLALQEQFVVLYLNRANLFLGGYRCSVGGLTGTVADIRLILGVALKACACNIIISHNHPSGSLKPSNTDIELTSRLKEAARIMEINTLDHIIVSPQEGEYYSFADEGLLLS